MKTLIFGPSGSGKTYITKELRKFNVNSIDADLVTGLCSWFDKNGNKVTYQENADKEWLNNHSFLWDKNFLKQYLIKNPNTILLGVSENIFDMFDLFDKVYYLDISENKQDERLRHKSRDNPMGSTEYQRKNAIIWGQTLKQKARELGIKFIDATQTPEEIYKKIYTENNH